MGGKDDDRGNDLDKWIEAQRAEITKLRDDLLGKRNDIDKDLQSWTEDASSSVKSPFERFKNFVDSNITTLSEGFKNFPSNISELKARMQLEREARMNEERDIWQAWTGSKDSPDHIQMQVERSTSDERELSREAVYQLLLQAYKKNQHVPADKILNLYRDNEWSFGGLDKFANPMLSFGGACYYKPETVENLPSTARWGWPAPSPQWLSVDWFKRSPYSPIRLERHPDLEDKGAKWRAAFEDLLSAALDKPMVTEEKIGYRSLYGKPQSTYYGPGLEWMLSLQCRGILPPQLPSLYKPVSLFDGFDEVKRPRTASFMHDIHQIITSRPATMYPLVRRDLEALVDEVSIKCGLEMEAAPPRIAWAAAPWRVPDTEEDLYNEMPPFPKAEEPLHEFPYEDHYFTELRAAFYAQKSEKAAQIISEYFNLTKQADELCDLVWEVLDDIYDDSALKKEWVALDALRRSNVPAIERRKIEATFGMTQSDEYRERILQESQEDLYYEPEARPTRHEVPHRHNSSETPAGPDILAQLTTTETTRLPDGTVTTKVVLKQRFADGREEERETVHTSHEQLPGYAEKKAQDGEDSGRETKLIQDYEMQLRLLEQSRQENKRRLEMARQEVERVEPNRKTEEQSKKEKTKTGWFWS